MSILYIVQTFTRRGRKLIPATPQKVASEDEARRQAERKFGLMTGVVGAMAIEQEVDEEADEAGEAKVLARFGETPGRDD